MIPKSEPALRLARIFHRRDTTPWGEAEVREYKKLYKAGCFKSLDDLELIELYYQTERKKGTEGFHRRDLLRLLRYWPGELDRAREWKERIKKHPRGYGSFKKEREQGTATEEDFKLAGAEAKKMIADLRAKLRPQEKI